MASLQKKLRKWFKYILALALHYSGHNTRVICRSGQYIVLTFHKLDDESDVLHLSVKSETLKQVADWCQQLGELVSIGEVIAKDSDQVRFCLTFDDGYKNNIKILDTVAGLPVTVYIATGFIDSERDFWAQQLQEAIVNSEVKAIDLSMMDLGVVELADVNQRIDLIKNINNNIKIFKPEQVHNIIGEIAEQCGTCFSDDNGFMNWQDVDFLSKGGVEIGGHTHDHFITSRITDEEFEHQLDFSREQIKKHIGIDATHFAYPNGGKKDISENAPQVLKNARYDSAVTTIEGINQFGDNPYTIKRFNMDDTRLRSPFGKLSLALFTTLIANKAFYN
ncbi:MAG: polysaccharide deacetylase family protein [Cellvibrionaceae bacterium]